MGSTSLCTFGHGTLTAEAFTALLEEASIDEAIDIRSFPGSRRNPQYGREEMERWLPAAGLGYRWIGDLGGRRRPVPGSKHVALRNEAFRAYADYMETSSFRNGLDELLSLAGRRRVAVVCSESLWWRCHRRLLADHLTSVDGLEVVHLLPDGRQTPHQLTEGARLADGVLVYDAGITPSLL